MQNTVAAVRTIIRGLVRDQLKTDGRDEFTYTVSSNSYNFYLSENFITTSSIVVYLNGTEMSDDDWSFNTNKNRVEIEFDTSGEALSQGDNILVTYSYYKKYSDTEIDGYLKSALSYFPMYQYVKVFEIDENNYIINLNGENPTVDELYFIAIIASILIDPQNINIDMKDFKITANRKLSDQEQIKEAFVQFTMFLGTFNFEERIYLGKDNDNIY